MSMPFITADYRPKAVRPVECVKAGLDLVRSRYWLFVGLTVVGVLIGSVVPLGILMGPMMCGIYLTLFKTRRGQPIEFNDLFKGFDFFTDSLIATLLHLVPVMVIFVPSYILFYVGMIFMIPRNGEPDPTAMLTFFGFFAVFWLVMVVILIIVSVGFTFAYPLIVDRKMKGLDAVKLSIKAGMANFWQLLGMLLLNGLLSFVGVLLCYVGVFLVLPVSFAAIAVAYEQVFGLASFEPGSNLPPPPPTFT
ncbi:MAG TPA: hypothetical protein VJT50_14185 [Pyrinomonadaceae bacterium]|nr:hypothetical protein [Pyrinomonadaceae bacterium]